MTVLRGREGCICGIDGLTYYYNTLSNMICALEMYVVTLP